MKEILAGQVDNFRYERKFYLEKISPRETELFLKFHPAMFRGIYHERRVNNIYLDSHDFANYQDTVNGVSQRIKYRIRWYGGIFGDIAHPVLEIKLKHNHHVGKISYPLEPMRLDNRTSIGHIQSIIKRSSLPQNIKFEILNLEIKLLNTYQRKYFLSSDGLFRVTIDSQIQGYGLSPHQNYFMHRFDDRETTILELKYNKNSDDFANDLTQMFPIRMARNSKYVEGLKRLYS